MPLALLQFNLVNSYLDVTKFAVCKLVQQIHAIAIIKQLEKL